MAHDNQYPGPSSDAAQCPYWLVTRARVSCQLINQFYWASKNDPRPNEISSIQSQFRLQVNVSVQSLGWGRSSAKFRNVCGQLFVRSLNISPHVQCTEVSRWPTVRSCVPTMLCRLSWTWSPGPNVSLSLKHELFTLKKLRALVLFSI